jgi:hypothetical protein
MIHHSKRLSHYFIYRRHWAAVNTMTALMTTRPSAGRTFNTNDYDNLHEDVEAKISATHSSACHTSQQPKQPDTSAQEVVVESAPPTVLDSCKLGPSSVVPGENLNV